jgi:Flp pilus assembly pilin Flp
MSEYEMLFTYMSAMLGRFRDDDDGAIAAEYIVLVGLAIVAAVVVGGILWSKLKTGANNTDVPAPAAP